MARKVHIEGDESTVAATAAEGDKGESNPAQGAPDLEGGGLGIADDHAKVAPSNRVFTQTTAKRYQVMGTARINSAGGITHLHPGQLIDEANYDIKGLRQAGVKLQLFVEPSPESETDDGDEG